MYTYFFLEENEEPTISR